MLAYRPCGIVAALVPALTLVVRWAERWAICRTYVRTLGRTRFADPGLYDEVFLSEEQRAAYFRDGVAVVRGALRPAVLEGLREVILETTNPLMRRFGGFASNLWMDSDGYLDFLVHSNLGHLAAQIFAHGPAETAARPEAAYVWRDFMVERNGIQGPFLAWHVDKDECEGDLPANYTTRSRLRFAIPLADNVRGTVVLNQSAYAAAMSPAEAARYWRGELPQRDCGTHCGKFWWGLPPLPGVRLDPERAIIHTGRLRLGDVVMFSACAWHRSPGFNESGLHFVLQPAYAPASSRIFGRIPLGCRHDLPVGDGLTGSPACFPRAHPRRSSPSETFSVRRAYHRC